MDVREKAESEKRLIDSTKLIDALPIVAEDKKISLMGAVADMVMLISEQPVIDAVPVVRCKDCKYCDISLVLPTGRKMYNCMEGSHDHQTLLKSNDFCSRGERRKEYE